jgi:hypothetical protein
MIHSHLYTRLAETPVYGEPIDDGRRICFLAEGNWVGVIKRQGEWVRVISKKGQGWIKADHLEARPPFQLHAFWIEGQSITYATEVAGQ